MNEELHAKMKAALAEVKAQQDNAAPTGSCEVTVGEERYCEEGITFKACRAAGRLVDESMIAWTKDGKCA